MSKPPSWSDQLGEGMREEFVVLGVQDMHVLRLSVRLVVIIVHWTEGNRLTCALSEYLNSLARRLLNRLLTDRVLALIIIPVVMLKDVPCGLSI